MNSDLAYAGFWARLRAGLVDFLVFVPLMPLSLWSLGEGPSQAAAVYVAGSVLYFAYAIVGHAVWGQTLGKRLAGIKVADLAGAPIGWRRAWRRSAVDIVLGAVSSAAHIVTLHRISAAEFDALGWIEIQERYDAIRPWWAAGAEYLYWTWLASEIISVLFNHRKRALHDFLAGTVVLHVQSSSAERRVPMSVGSRALVWANSLVAAAFAAIALLSLLGAFGTTAQNASDTRTGILVIAVVTCIAALIFAAASRAFYTASPKRWYVQSIAVGVAVLLSLPFLT